MPGGVLVCCEFLGFTALPGTSILEVAVDLVGREEYPFVGYRQKFRIGEVALAMTPMRRNTKWRKSKFSKRFPRR